MPYGYAAALFIAAVPMLAALTASARPGPAGTIVFYLSVVVNEAPFLWLAWVGAATALTWGLGALSVYGAAAAAAVALGLVVLALRAAAARQVLEQVMGPLPRSRSWGRLLLGPVLRRRRTVEHVRGLPYGPEDRNSLDLYRRPGSRGGPVLVHFFGGGYRSGRKDTQSLALLYRLAEAGWVCVSADYRLRPAAGFTDHLLDAKRVIAWIRKHGREWGADPRRIVLAGSSAGAHLAASAAFTAADRALQPGFEDVDTAVSAVIGFGGYYGTYYGQGPRTSPLGLAGPAAPPCLIVHGERDTVVPVADARHFAQELRDVSAQRVVLAVLPGGQHAFDLGHSLRFDAVMDAVEAFTGTVLASGRDPK
ncbi:alpha/beta hydrolase [Glycomyces sp. NPDC047010]|uniref:alpha/beta hydrolase n=1 Tax=Glycomyces sp. NPDC047010 TaxID=3155023 RepID=UPI00341135CC